MSARGTYAIGRGGDTAEIESMVELGLPVQHLTLRDFGDWRIGSAGIMSVMKNPPHPAGVKLLVNWLLSEDGWTERVRTVRENPELTTSYREVVPLHTARSTDHLEPHQRLPEEGFYLAPTDPDFLSVIEEGRGWFKQMGSECGF